MSERHENEVRVAWEDVSERLTGWGRLVAARYRTAEPAAPTTTTEPSDRKLDDTARDLGDQLNRVVTALGDTLRDDAAKEQLRGAMKAIGDAVSVTVNETAEQIRRRVDTGPRETTEGSNRASNGNGATPAGPATDDGSVPPPPGA